MNYKNNDWCCISPYGAKRCFNNVREALAFRDKNKKYIVRKYSNKIKGYVWAYWDTYFIVYTFYVNKKRKTYKQYR
jgi:hypothetical protein